MDSYIDQINKKKHMIIIIPIISILIILLLINLVFAPHDPYKEKNSPFECGFHSFIAQNRTQFNISFFIFALLFLLFDLEILLVYPYMVSAYVNGVYGLMFMLIFFLVLTLGFAFELGKGALKLTSKQNNSNINPIKNIYRTKTIVLKSQIWEPVFLLISSLGKYINYLKINVEYKDIVLFSYDTGMFYLGYALLLLSLLLPAIGIIVLNQTDEQYELVKTDLGEFKINYIRKLNNPEDPEEAKKSQKEKVLMKLNLQLIENRNVENVNREIENAEPGTRKGKKSRNIYNTSYSQRAILNQTNMNWLHSAVMDHPAKVYPYIVELHYRDNVVTSTEKIEVLVLNNNLRKDLKKRPVYPTPSLIHFVSGCPEK